MYYLKSSIGKIVSQNIPVSWETYLLSGQFFQAFGWIHAIGIYVNRYEKHFYVLRIGERIYEYHNLCRCLHHLFKVCPIIKNKIKFFNAMIYKIRKANLPCLEN